MNSSERSKLMAYIRETGFAIDDVVLYLDTHPNDDEALQYYNKYKKMYREATREYAAHFGPLSDENVNTENGWAWVKGPWPWEGGC